MLLCGAAKPSQELVPLMGPFILIQSFQHCPQVLCLPLHGRCVDCSPKSLHKQVVMSLLCLQPVGDMGCAASIESVTEVPSLYILTQEMSTLVTLYCDGPAVQAVNTARV